MCKKLFFSVLLAFVANMAFAQNVLQITDVSQPNDVFSSSDDGAALMIRCHRSIPLRFTSSMDKSADPFKTELQGTDSIYYIAFPTGDRYRGRELTVYAKGYAPVSYELDLRPKQLVTLNIIDPNSMVDAGCYRGHRNKGMEELKNMNYEEARNQFVVASECSDVDSVENNRNIARADSLIDTRQKADAAFRLLDYRLASQYYSEVLALNPYDTYASNRNTMCVQNFQQECMTMYTKAEHYYNEKDYDKAKELYQTIINKECSMTTIATERINAISSLQTAKKDHARVFTYEWRKDSPIGLSYGKYNMHKVGGFFQMDFNAKVFDAIRKDCHYGDEKFPELNIAFGWTVKIYDPIWIHVGPGFTGKMYYGSYLSDKYPEKGFGETELLDQKEMGSDLTLPRNDVPANYEDGWKKANFAFAVSPIIGITAKYSYFAIRLTYQYRWSVQSKLQDFMGRSRLSVGVGVAF